MINNYFSYVAEQFQKATKLKENYNGDETQVHKINRKTALLIVAFALMVWLWVAIYWFSRMKVIPAWANVVAAVSLFSGYGGPVLALAVIYFSQ